MKTNKQIPKSGDIEIFNAKIMEWSKDHLRSFPWREANYSDYARVISEVMLQRTRAETVAKIFPTFIARYPDWVSLAEANIESLEKVIRPLGLYKRRARSLKSLALAIMCNNGEIPSERSAIMALPGVGQYIANAIELLVYSRAKALLDVNMARVLERYFGPRELVDIRYDPFLQSLSERVVRATTTPSSLNFAILDYAALVCKTTPECTSCKLKIDCRYFYNTMRNNCAIT